MAFDTSGSTPSPSIRTRGTPMRAPRTSPVSAAREVGHRFGRAGGVGLVHARQSPTTRARRRRPIPPAARSDRATTQMPGDRNARRARRSASSRRFRKAPPAAGSIRRCRIRAPAVSSRRRRQPPSRRSTRPESDRSPTDSCVGPNAEFSVDDPIANSSQLVLPTMTAPAASSFSTTVALYGGTNDSRIFDDAVVRTPRVEMLSLSATGTPVSGWSRQRVRSRSSAAARSSA